MTKTEREQLLNVIELATRCYSCLQYGVQVNNLEQKEADTGQLSELNSAFANSFEPFQSEIVKGLDEWREQRIEEIVSKMEEIEKNVSLDTIIKMTTQELNREWLKSQKKEK